MLAFLALLDHFLKKLVSNMFSISAHLPKAKVGFGCIALKVNIQGRKDLNLFLFHFDTCCPFIQNLQCNCNIYLGMKLPQAGANEM